MEIEEQALMTLVDKALARLYRRDRELIWRGVHEETISHRLAIYLEVLLFEHFNLKPFDSTGYDVDIEYNKNGENVKRLVRGGSGRRPDIIVHKRGHNDNNLLIIEVKKRRRTQISQSDDSKLCGATDPNHDFRYKLGLYLNLMTDCVDLAWYRNGVQQETIRKDLENLGYGQ